MKKCMKILNREELLMKQRNLCDEAVGGLFAPTVYLIALALKGRKRVTNNIKEDDN